jgi:hypothetical protein
MKKRSDREVFRVVLLFGLIGVILAVVLIAVALRIMPAKGTDRPSTGIVTTPARTPAWKPTASSRPNEQSSHLHHTCPLGRRVGDVVDRWRGCAKANDLSGHHLR